MREIDTFSRVVGAMFAFNEMIKCGCKHIALGIPTSSPQERDEYMEHAVMICKAEGTKCCRENGGLITDLFPASMNKGKYNILFYEEDVYRDLYFSIKERKQHLVDENRYCDIERTMIAYEFGRLLSYTDAAIKRMIAENRELE
jgi:hypothetical protein